MRHFILALLTLLSVQAFGQRRLWITGPTVPQSFDVVYVYDFVTGGSGTDSDPWTGWNTIPWTHGKTYLFSNGVYGTSSTISIVSKMGVHLIGAGMPVQQNPGFNGTVLKMTGSGPAISITGAHYGNSIEGLLITGNPNCTDGIYIANGQSNCVRDVMIRDISSAALHLSSCTTTLLENIFVSSYGDVLSPCPRDGILLDGQTTTTTIINPYVCTGYLPQSVDMNGLRLNNSLCNTLIGGAFETCTGRGIVLENTSTWNSFYNAYTENDSMGAVLIGDGSVFNRFHDCYLYEGFGARSQVLGGYNIFTDCLIGSMLIAPSATKTKVTGGAATITNNGNGTILTDVYLQ